MKGIGSKEWIPYEVLDQNENMHVMGFWCFSWSRLSMHLSIWWWMRSNNESGSEWLIIMRSNNG